MLMELISLPEPLLEFSAGTDVCPRSGIAQHGVYDMKFASRRTSILVGAVGTANPNFSSNLTASVLAADYADYTDWAQNSLKCAQSV